MYTADSKSVHHRSLKDKMYHAYFHDMWINKVKGTSASALAEVPFTFVKSHIMIPPTHHFPKQLRHTFQGAFFFWFYSGASNQFYISVGITFLSWRFFWLRKTHPWWLWDSSKDSSEDAITRFSFCQRGNSVSAEDVKTCQKKMDIMISWDMLTLYLLFSGHTHDVLTLW